MAITTKTGSTNSDTGGTAVSYVRQSSDSGNTVYIEDGAEFSARKKLTLKASGGTRNSGAPGGYSHRRFVSTLAKPNVLADGETVDYDTLQVSFSGNVETTEAEVAAMISEMFSSLVPSGDLNSALSKHLLPD